VRFRSGNGVAGRWRAGAALTIRGEFSIVIAGPVLTRYADAFGRSRARAATRRVRSHEVAAADPVH